MRLLTKILFIFPAFALAGAPAMADELDDILGTGSDSSDDNDDESVEDEVRAVRSGDLDDNIGSRSEDIVVLEEDLKKDRLIKTIQRKKFLKLGRWEASPHLAFVANDPFLNRYIVGTGLAYNVTEIFAVEVSFDFAPDLGERDWKPLTKQLVEENHVSPDISKLTYFGSLTFQFSPIYGKVAMSGRDIINFDIFAAFGMGVTRTSDDLEALDTEATDDRAVATQHQMHPTTNFGGGARIIFDENLAFRIEGRSLVYIEAVNATTLEMKNNLLIQAAVSIFFPALK